MQRTQNNTNTHAHLHVSFSDPTALAVLHEHLVLLHAFQCALQTPQSENTPPPGGMHVLATVNAQLTPLLGAVVSDPVLRSHASLVTVVCKV